MTLGLTLEVAHRDLKPDNVLVMEDRHLKLIDFDAAVDIGSTIRKDEEGKKTSTAFCPPELAAVLFRPEQNVEVLEAELRDNPLLLDGDDEYAMMAVLQKRTKIKAQIAQLRDGAKGTSAAGLEAAPTFDVWSFGVVMFELCTGERLFNRGANDDDISG